MDILHTIGKDKNIYIYKFQYLNIYIHINRDFFKLWHYKMDVVTCTDPTSEDEEFQSNTFYPPGMLINY